MDDLEKHASSYQQDQEILDARGINMTVEEVAGLPTVKYSEKVQSLQLNEGDLSFLKGLRRRIKNRLASQNSRRRSLEHLRRLTRELRCVRARRDAALAERRALLRSRDMQRDRCRTLRLHISQVLQSRSDLTQLPELDDLESPKPKEIKTSSSPDLSESYRDSRETFECRIEKLVQKSVNHIFDKKKVAAKTVFLDDKKCLEDGFKHKMFERTGAFVKEEIFDDGKDFKNDIRNDFMDVGIKQEYDNVLKEENGGVLDLCVKAKRSHGRKQSAPRRIAYVHDYDDMVLDLKIKKENQ
ncbi:nuclear factor erythroid 2-related factor 2-like [Leguminivora glycinivorella]|uniref:nuclear factor erythroid 2-related factor 2-like n=1 Tax=Leguminivora glycinivorella TaxID=1035111 RepID=UPI00200DE977|nr:nuclear factor erythroid 2-related factor 2-like [Leguminivora glycinivorella]